MKPEWHQAICDAAAAGLRLDHAEGCAVIYGGGTEEGCNCAASAANAALNEIAEGLKTGIPVPLDDKREPFRCAGGVEISSLWEEPCPKCGATDDDECRYVAPASPPVTP